MVVHLNSENESYEQPYCERRWMLVSWNDANMCEMPTRTTDETFVCSVGVMCVMAFRAFLKSDGNVTPGRSVWFSNPRWRVRHMVSNRGHCAVVNPLVRVGFVGTTPANHCSM